MRWCTGRCISPASAIGLHLNYETFPKRTKLSGRRRIAAKAFSNTATWQRTLASNIVWLCLTAHKALEFVHPWVALAMLKLASVMQLFVSGTVELVKRGLLWLARAAEAYNAANDATRGNPGPRAPSERERHQIN
jgi:hypothetical protein